MEARVAAIAGILEWEDRNPDLTYRNCRPGPMEGHNDPRLTILWMQAMT